MLLQRIIIDNFRNINCIDFEPSPDVNILYGKNAQGKTSIVEAIYFIGHLKSFRCSKNADLIAYNKKHSKISGNFFSEHVQKSIKINLEAERKTVCVDGKIPASLKELFKVAHSIVFSPEEINFIKGGPIGRRTLLDRAVFQTNYEFINIFREYNRYLQQRNKLLRVGATEKELFPWTEGLIQVGARLRLERFLFVRSMGSLYTEIFARFSGMNEHGELHYSAGSDNENDLRNRFRQKIIDNCKRERQYGQTLEGPHRDDVDFFINGRSVRNFGSQGQQRSVVLTFKIAQVIDHKNKTGESPILLLDDMSSELDKERQTKFFDFFLNIGSQVFITTTDLTNLTVQRFKNGRFFQIKSGSVQEFNP